MKIETMRELKEALNEVPSEVLDNFIIAQDEDGSLALCITEGEDSGEMMDNYEKHTKAYPILNAVALYVRSIEDVVRDEANDGEIKARYEEASV